MSTHAIVELEEGAINVVVGRRDGAAPAITRSLRLQLPEFGRDALLTALRAVPGDMLQGVAGVHVVLGDRRFQHFVSSVPRMRSSDVVAFVTREALRLTSARGPSEVLTAVRIAQALPGGRLRLAGVALPRAVFEPLAQAFEAAGVAVLGLYSMETCLALAATAPGPLAVLECNAGRARFVLVDDGCPLQVRRFLVNGGDGNAGALLAQLAMELPRTLDWLRESGLPMPGTLVLGTRVDVADADIDALRNDDLPRIERAAAAWSMPPNTATPGLGVVLLLRQLCAGRTPPSLLAPPRLAMPLSRQRFVAVAAAMVAAAGLAGSGIVDLVSWSSVRAELHERRHEGNELMAQLTRAAGVARSPDADAARLQQAQAMRRPVSRLVSQVSNAAPPGLVIEGLDFASAERVVVTGVVGGSTRQEALASLAAFGSRLRALPYLEAAGDDEVGEVAGQDNRFRFKSNFGWRNP